MSFKDRFKGKCALIGKEGVDAMIGKSSRPIDKSFSHSNSYMHDSSYSFRSLNLPNTHEKDYNTDVSPLLPDQRNRSQVNKMRHKFESERKAHRNNLYNSIIRNDRSANMDFATEPRAHSDAVALMNPRWNKSLMKKQEVKRKLFHDHNGSERANYSVSIPQDQEMDFIAGLSGDFKVSKNHNRNNTIRHENDKSYDILIIDKNSNMSDYDTSVSMFSNVNPKRSFNRSQKVGMMLDNRIRKRKEDRYRPFTLRDYTKNVTEENQYAKLGGLGPEIGSEKWRQEKIKRERIKDFSNRLNNLKKEQLIMKNAL